MTRGDPFDTPAWWASLKHGGMLIAPARLVEFLAPDCPPLPRHLADRLRRDLLRVREGDADHLGALLDTVLEDVLGLGRRSWSKGSDVDARWSHKAVTGEIVKPRRLWQPGEDVVLPVFVADSATTGHRPRAAEGGPFRYADEGRLGIGRGRRPVSRVVEWLRRSGEKVALLTNGRQWRLMHAGADFDAWCEWDTDLWFEEGAPGPQVTALRILLGEASLQPPRAGEPPPLVAAILASRRGQAELSAALGEHVRLAVERLIRESGAVLSAIEGSEPERVSRRDIYIAATRLVMRCVVILFAEARRELLPRDNPIYEGCYGAQGLREQLARLAGGRAERLRHSHSGWPRLLSLFRLIYQGSPHEALPIPRYGGGLFAPGDPSSKDPVLRALAAFEDPRNAPTDAAIHEILELLCVSKVKVRQGRASTWVPAPVDFSDLSSEYIGILYEGLLDFELHRAPDHDAMVFLRLGDEPALPLSRLEEEMAPKRLAELIGKLQKSTKKLATAEAEEETGEEEEQAEVEDDELGETEREEADAEASAEEPVAGGEADAGVAGDIVRIVRVRAEIWAEKAVKEAKLVPYPRPDVDPLVRDRWNKEVKKKARALYRLVLPGQWYLVRWGGTRKGAGTFYTRPQLAVPTARRALQPLCYEPAEEMSDETTGLTTVTRWVPRRPEDILALKVCDPAMGSGSFLVAALRYLTDALVESLHFYGRLHARPDGAICKLADGLPLDHPAQETLPVPLDHPEFDERLRARLKRHVVERCIYGVDIDPLAVELARMALWVETMDRRLPFGFLDHKLRCGNSLVGCWFDRFQDYPVMAFERDDAGDKNHDRFVHHFREYTAQRGKKKGELQRSGDVWTQRWKQVKDEVIKPEVRAWITSRREDVFPFMRQGYSAEGLHDAALAVFRELHDLPVHEVERREQLYRERIADNPALARLREAFDTWCAIWFWPGDALDLVPTPKNFQDPPEATRQIVAQLREEHHFFHWELEFPDVFTGPSSDSGFRAIVGNPPWDTIQPMSKEFFSSHDPLFRTYGKQEALASQSVLFADDAAVELAWIRYQAHIRALAHWARNIARPFGDPQDVEKSRGFSLGGPKESAALHDAWRHARRKRRRFAAAEHPFAHQGDGKTYTYKLFLEMVASLLQQGGRYGMVLPSGFYSDVGAKGLRQLVLEELHLEDLFAFENRDNAFSVASSVKFATVVGSRSGRADAVLTRFMLNALADWEPLARVGLGYRTELLRKLSPELWAFVELNSSGDLRVMECLLEHTKPLGSQEAGWALNIRQGDFNLTTHSRLFLSERQLGQTDATRFRTGWWGRGGGGAVEAGDVILPLYQGRMLWHFDFACASYDPAQGWCDQATYPREVRAKHYVPLVEFAARRPGAERHRLLFRYVTKAVNERTFAAAVCPPFPCGHTVGVIEGVDDTRGYVLVALLNSFVFDWITRLRFSGGMGVGALDPSKLVEYSLPPVAEIPSGTFAGLARASESLTVSWSASPDSAAISPHERLRLRVNIDVLAASLFGIGVEDLRHILRDCDHPLERSLDRSFTRGLDQKGFWRVDKELDPELRHTVLTLVAFRELKRLGPKTFLALNDGEGWMLPEALRLSDYDLGHDDRAQEPQPVASRLGPRFLPWQLEQTPEASWEECARHAERLDALLGRAPTPPGDLKAHGSPKPSPATDLFGQPLPTDLFGNTLARGPRRRQ